jgi:hypothetical protein
MGKKCPRLLNGDGDEKALPSGEQTCCYPWAQQIIKTEQFKL